MFHDYSIDDLIKWRNNASERVSKGDFQIDQIFMEIDKISKKIISDIRWIRKLNKEINQRAFGYKKTIYHVKS